MELNHYEALEYKNGDEPDRLAFKVDSLDEFLKIKREFIACMGSSKEEGKLWTYVKDPDGIWIELYDKTS